METPQPRPGASRLDMCFDMLPAQQAVFKEVSSLCLGCFLAAGQAEGAGNSRIPFVPGALSQLVNLEKPKYFNKAHG